MTDWAKYRTHILSFADAMGFLERSDEQERYLCNVMGGATRVGVLSPCTKDAMPVIFTLATWRALCWQVPTLLIVNRPRTVGCLWLKGLKNFLEHAHPSMTNMFRYFCTLDSCATTEGVPVLTRACCIEDIEQKKPVTDICFVEFDRTPRTVMNAALKLGDQGGITSIVMRRRCTLPQQLPS